MMRILGELCLQIAFVGSGYSAFACGMSHRERWCHLSRTGMWAAVMSLLALLVTSGVLGWALVERNFQFEYVAHYTNRLLPWHYSLSALWVGQAGSLLLWACLSGLLAVVFLVSNSIVSRLQRVAFGILMGNVCFLCAIMVFAADPMKASLTTRSEGLGLSPLLQHPSMLIHPPVIFLAYAAWAVPFALAIAALVTGEVDARWTRQARLWALFAWCVLGGGLLLGANWAYQELGWGGYWGWDPVENGSLIPWLSGTALIHSLMVWRHRGGLKRMAVSLAVLTFALCNFATFLTRSGIFSSVHAFSESPIGWMFLALMAGLLIGGASLIYLRRRQLAPDRPVKSFFSREFLVLVAAYLILLLTGVVLVGTLCVPLSTMFGGRTVQIGPAFYNNVLMPIGILLLAATAVVPLVRWGSAPERLQRQTLLVCVGLGCIAAGAAFFSGVRHPASLAVTGLSVLAGCSTLASLFLDARRFNVRLSVGLWLAVTRHRRQYAGYVIHLALACVTIGITGSSLGTRRHEAELNEGDVLEWAGRRIEYVRLIQRAEPDKLIAEVELKVSRPGQQSVSLMPARHLHRLQDMWTSEVAIHSTWAGDLYTILNAGLGEGRVVVTFVENPLMRWIWCGGGLAAVGTLVAAWPTRRKRVLRVQHASSQRLSVPIVTSQSRRAA